MNEIKRLYDDERRKTSSNEKTIAQIYNENKSMATKLKQLQMEVDEYKENIESLEEQIKKATSVISTLEYAN